MGTSVRGLNMPLDIDQTFNHHLEHLGGDPLLGAISNCGPLYVGETLQYPVGGRCVHVIG